MPNSQSLRSPFVLLESKLMKPFELVHFDLWGPTPIPVVNRMCYFLSFINDFPCFTWLYLLKTKNDIYLTNLEVLLILNLKLKPNPFKQSGIVSFVIFLLFSLFMAFITNPYVLTHHNKMARTWTVKIVMWLMLGEPCSHMLLCHFLISHIPFISPLTL